MMSYYTYILVSDRSGQYYIGQTNDLEDRILRHNSNRNRWTKNKGPWKLEFSRGFESRSEAMALEKRLKGFKNKEYLAASIDKEKGKEAAG